MVGGTGSPDFPTTPGALDTTYDNGDAFVTKLNQAGTGLEYSTFLGGSGSDGAGDVFVRHGIPYVFGYTTSTDFPVLAAPRTNPDAAAGFFAALDTRGSKLVRSTLVKPPFYGGSVDAHGNPYVLVNVLGADVMATAGAFDPSFNGGTDMFVMALGCKPGRAATSRAACDRPDAARGP